MEATHLGFFFNVRKQSCSLLHLPFHFLGFSWSNVPSGAGSASVSLACGLEPTSVFPRDKNKRKVMAIFVILHPKENFMGQREDTSMAQGDFLC